MRALICVCPPSVECLFPPVLSESCNQILVAFKVWFSRNSSSPCHTPRLGSLTWGSEPSLQWVDFCGISVLQFLNHPPSSYGIWFYCDCTPPTISLWLLLCLWMWGIFFGEFQCLPVNDCSTVSCDSGVLARGSESTPFYSAILVQGLNCILLYQADTLSRSITLWIQVSWHTSFVCFPIYVADFLQLRLLLYWKIFACLSLCQSISLLLFLCVILREFIFSIRWCLIINFHLWVHAQ